MGGEENRMREAIAMKDADKNCCLSLFPPAAASDSFFQGSLQLRR